jgi:hypothetical protein
MRQLAFREAQALDDFKKIVEIQIDRSIEQAV